MVKRYSIGLIQMLLFYSYGPATQVRWLQDAKDLKDGSLVVKSTNKRAAAEKYVAVRSVKGFP